MKFLLLLSILIFPVFAEPASSVTKVIKPSEAQEYLSLEKKPLVLDVRTPEEFKESHVPSALNINVKSDDFAVKLADLDKEKTYLVYCRSGKRSSKAVAIMEKLGFKSILHMDEGMIGYAKLKE